MSADLKTKTVIITLRRYKKNKKNTGLVTTYNYTQVLKAYRSGIDNILVGDS
tara:strand:+ start:937 stop:1092 length:156 start_codon:yes stop_codon:yes gene_type:complete